MAPALHLLRSALRPAGKRPSAASHWCTSAASTAALGGHAATVLRLCVIPGSVATTILHRRLSRWHASSPRHLGVDQTHKDTTWRYLRDVRGAPWCAPLFVMLVSKHKWMWWVAECGQLVNTASLSGARCLPTLSRDRLLEIGARGSAATPHDSCIYEKDDALFIRTQGSVGAERCSGRVAAVRSAFFRSTPEPRQVGHTFTSRGCQLLSAASDAAADVQVDTEYRRPQRHNHSAAHARRSAVSRMPAQAKPGRRQPPPIQITFEQYEQSRGSGSDDSDSDSGPEARPRRQHGDARALRRMEMGPSEDDEDDDSGPEEQQRRRHADVRALRRMEMAPSDDDKDDDSDDDAAEGAAGSSGDEDSDEAESASDAGTSSSNDGGGADLVSRSAQRVLMLFRCVAHNRLQGSNGRGRQHQNRTSAPLAQTGLPAAVTHEPAPATKACLAFDSRGAVLSHCP